MPHYKRAAAPQTSSSHSFCIELWAFCLESCTRPGTRAGKSAVSQRPCCMFLHFLTEAVVKSVRKCIGTTTDLDMEQPVPTQMEEIGDKCQLSLPTLWRCSRRRLLSLVLEGPVSCVCKTRRTLQPIQISNSSWTLIDSLCIFLYKTRLISVFRLH